MRITYPNYIFDGIINHHGIIGLHYEDMKSSLVL